MFECVCVDMYMRLCVRFSLVRMPVSVQICVSLFVGARCINMYVFVHVRVFSL